MDLLDLFIAPAYAQAAPAPGGSMWQTLLLPIVFIGLMYVLMIRPQMKRQKEHRAMLDKLQRGDEVITSGGIAGTVSDMHLPFHINLEVAQDSSRLVNQPWQKATKLLVTERARSIRDCALVTV